MDIKEAVILRLKSLGYKKQEGDGPALEYSVAQSEQWLLSNLNQRDVPDGLLCVWADMAAAQMMMEQRASGADGMETPAPVVKSVSEGDTSVTYAVSERSAAELQLDALLARMMRPEENVLAAFRRMKW